MNSHKLDPYFKALLCALLWQSLPSLVCAILYSHESQTVAVFSLLLIVMPVVAGGHYFYFIEKAPRQIFQASLVALLTCLVGVCAILTYVALALVLMRVFLGR